MCGIVGWVDWKQDLRDKGHTIDRMADAVKHRGPDQAGTWLSNQAALGNRRLIVVDPVGGEQPMEKLYQGSSWVITYKGELYNTLELRRILERKGYVFNSRNSDTEVLLTSYIEWGTECVKSLRGIYAFGIWKESDQTLFLARDRLGVKPLFYYCLPHGILFASEAKCILKHPDVKAQVDGEGLAEIFYMGPARSPGHGIFKGLGEMEPGTWILYSPEKLSIKKYWSLESRPHFDSLDDTAARLKELFVSSVKSQLVSDRPLCTLLSGGLDSSAITALAAEGYKGQDGDALATFSVDYSDSGRYFAPNYFETGADNPWIHMVSNYLGTRHHSIVLDNVELAQALESALLANDRPGMADVDTSLYLFSREVKKEAVVALSGECADEIMGGYPWFYDPEVTQTPAFPWIRMVAERQRFLSPLLLGEINGDEYLQARYKEAIKEVPSLEGETTVEVRMREITYLNITRFMSTLLDRKDRMSMAQGLEVRVPFADHEFLQYAWNIPWPMKNCQGMAKGIFRKAMKGLLPGPVLERKKNPYPKTHHPQYGEEVRKMLLRILNDPLAPVRALIDKTTLQYQIASGRPLFHRPWFSQLMGDIQYLAYLWQINRWLEKYEINLLL